MAALAQPGAVLELVAHWGRTLSGADTCLIALRGPDGALEVEVVALAPGEAPTWVGCHLADVDQRLVLVPLRTRGWDFGMLGFIWAGDQPESEEALHQVRSFADQAAVTLGLVEARAEQQRLAIFEDRDRIARDLHDLALQRLFAAGMMLKGVTGHHLLPHEAADRIASVIEELDETANEIRQTIRALHGPIGRGEGGGVRLRILQEVERAGATMRCIGDIDSIGAVADDLVATVREGLSNCSRHAQASRIEVLVERDARWLTATVADDGIGVSEKGPTRRSGLVNLADRAAALGGECLLTRGSKSGGTRLVWRVPLG